MLRSRRSFLAATAALAATGYDPPETGPTETPAPEAPLKLSLSVRVVESFSDKRNSTIFDAMHDMGYGGYLTVHQAF